MKTAILSLLVLAAAGPYAHAAVKTKTVTYEHDGVTFKGYLAYDDASKDKRPGILVVHEWWGLNDYARKRAEQLAGMGYVAFAADMYGEGKTTEHPKEAGQLSGAVRKDIKTWLGRAKAALKVLQENELVDGKRLAAIGYCFGGSTALQLAFHGTDIAAAVSFHGSLPIPESTKNIKAKVLICHGEKDGFISEESIKKVKAALDDGKVDYKFVSYPDAVHSFTVPEADKRSLKGIGYNAEADRRSWQDMTMLFREIFAKR